MAVEYDPNPQFAQYASPERLVSASWLSARLGTPGLRVIESDGDSLSYDIGHLPGALRLDWFKDLNDRKRRDYISAEDFAWMMRNMGINETDTVVIYGDKSNRWAAFTFWIFEMFGHKDVRLLDGGRDAWMAEERDTSFAVQQFPRSQYSTPNRDDHPRRIFVQEVLQRLGEPTLIDVRSRKEYLGEEERHPRTDGITRGGHIPTAINKPWDRTVLPNGRFRPREELDALYKDLPRDAETVVYCQIGERAAHSWFVLRYLLGYEQVRNYDGGWIEWGNMVRMPIGIGEAPGEPPAPAS